ncbi:hypothetical protein MRB53_022915 [Persea americana]|uniref:Uncharacterized protein n=1 Tax=Persea americana TaxID=3435 RepID=A0ACC2L7X7_PERAE|nr:hypothetical protein MRB53_022915 [Persea americana]
MGLALLLSFYLLTLVSVSSLRDMEIETNAHETCTESFQGHHHLSNDSDIHFTIHHIHGPCSPVSSRNLSPSEILKHDDARVQTINRRLTHPTIPSTLKFNKLRPKPLNIPLNSGSSAGVGNYVIKVGLGTPSKMYVMVVDTGSSFSWLQCEPCTGYCHSQIGPIFNPEESTTYKSIQCDTSECTSLQDATLNSPNCSSTNVCTYVASYGDGSTSKGYLGRDKLTVQAHTIPGFIYGCGQINNGLFGRTAGLMGLSRNKLSLLSQLSSKYGYVLSYCLPTTTSTGKLSIGWKTYDPSLYEFTRMYTDPQDPSLYLVRLIRITVDGMALPVSVSTYMRRPTIIDSGTLITRLPSAVYTALRAAFEKAMSRFERAPRFSLLDTCYKGIGGNMSVPEVNLVFEGGSGLKLEARNVMYDVGDGVSCLAFAANGWTNGVSIIGNLQQQTFRVVYDVANSRIGFAAGGCR